MEVLRRDFESLSEQVDNDQIKFDKVDDEKEKMKEEVEKQFDMEKQLALRQVESDYKERSELLKSRIVTNGERLNKDAAYLTTYDEDVNDLKRKWDSSKDDLEDWRKFCEVQNGLCGVSLTEYDRKQQEDLAGAKIPLEDTKKVIYDTLTDLVRGLQVDFDSIEEYIIHAMSEDQISNILNGLSNHGIAHNPKFYSDKKWIATTKKKGGKSKKESKILFACRMIRTLTPSDEQLSDYVSDIESKQLQSFDETEAMTLSSRKRKPVFDRDYTASVQQKFQESATKRARCEFQENQRTPSKPAPADDSQNESATMTWQLKTPDNSK